MNMASILDLYNKSEFKTLPDTTKDKTPIEADGGKNLSIDEAALKKARSGDLPNKKYTDTKPQ